MDSQEKVQAHERVEVEDAQTTPETNATGSTAKRKPANKTSAAQKSSKAKNPTKKKVAAPPWTFPKNTLEESLKIPRAIEEQNAGNPMKPDMLAKAIGYNSTSDWRFLDLLRSANLYGLVEGRGKTASVSLTPIGQDVVAPSSPSARPTALQRAFRSVEDFKKVEDFYQGKKLPEDEFFENTLHREFDIHRDRVKSFIDTFTSNLNYLHAFQVTEEPGGRLPSSFRSADPEIPDDLRSSGGRQFLDTCFVMMPFGPWMDRYYQEIYVPSIKDAGMEPVRADELFTTGSVIEQIWEQISNSKVLLADLTGKNANVFYELGLAHALSKPVVFTTSDLADVPFDLRHLRVAVYDIRDPLWGPKLKDELSSYLRAAKAEPEKSVPQPFRDFAKAQSHTE